MAAADQSYCEVQLDAEENYRGEFHEEQDVVQNSATPNENGCYSFGQESPASFMSALQELGNRILNTSEDMERRMAERFQQQIDRLDEKIWRLDTAARARPGGEPEDDLHGIEPEVLPGDAREPEIGRRNVENRPLLAKPLITPSPYDGKTSWDDYQVQFELIAELNGWNTSTMAIYLAASLSGCAQAVLTDLDANSRRNYQALKEALSLRFGYGGKMEVFRSQLKNRARGKDESLPELAQAIQRLVRQAYPEAPLSVREVLEKDYFVDAITDTDIRWKILQSRPRTIQEALATATEVEAFQVSQRQRLRPSRLTANMVWAQVPDKQGNTYDSSLSNFLTEIRKDLEDQRRLLEDLTRKIASPGRMKHWSTWGPRNIGRVMERGRSWGPGNNGRGNCWNCNHPGHFSRDCPELYYNQESRDGLSQKALGSVPRRFQRPMHSPRAGTLPGNEDQLGLYISGKVEGVDVKFLVDTGSNITILSPSVTEKIGAPRRPVLEEVDNHMILADGSSKPFQGKGTFEMEVDGKRALQEVWIADIELEGILGMDFVRRYGCQIISSPGGQLQLFIPELTRASGSGAKSAEEMKPSNYQCLRVMVEDTVLIPANGEMTTAAKVLDKCAGGLAILDQHSELLVGGSNQITYSDNLLEADHLLNEYQDVFATSTNPFGRTGITKHKIVTGESTPIKQTPRRLPLHLKEKAEEEVEKMSAKGIVEPSSSPDSSPVVLVKKENGTIHREQVEKVPQLARDDFNIASRRQERLYGHRSHVNSYREGEKRWLHNPQSKKGRGPKLETPRKVTKQVTDVVYRIQKTPKGKPKFVHHDRLKPFHERDMSSQ